MAALLCMASAVALTPSGVLAAGALVEGSASSVAQQREAQRVRIQAQRQAIEAERVRNEASCYQQFAVEDCLRRVRIQAREADNVLHRQEVQLNDAERREKAGQRLQSIEEHQREQRQRLEAGQRPAPMQASSRNKSPQLREQEAQDRAQQQSRRATERAAEVRRRERSLPQSMSESRTRYEAKQERARERRERQQAGQAGHKPATSLPQPASAGSGTP